MTPYPFIEGQQVGPVGSHFRFMQVDVFSDRPFLGNGLAVVLDAQGREGFGFDDDTMQAFASWTQLSETTFLFPPTNPSADYLVRIFTPEGELPFAGHPTLGSARAWLVNGGQPKHPGEIIQQCKAGLIRIRIDDGAPRPGSSLSTTNCALAFAAPPLQRSGEVSPEILRSAVEGCGLTMDDVVASNWVANGPDWLGILLKDADTVARAHVRTDDLEVGIIGPHAPGGPADFEVRAFCHDVAAGEDAVTGSLNAGLAKWLIGKGHAPNHYTVRQGTYMGRNGRITIDRHGDDIWVGGAAVTRIVGTLQAEVRRSGTCEFSFTEPEPTITTQNCSDIYYA